MGRGGGGGCTDSKFRYRVFHTTITINLPRVSPLSLAACLDTCPSVCLESELKHPSNSPVDEKLSMLVAPHNDGLPRPRHSHSHLSMEIQLFLAPAGAQRVSFSDPKPIWLYPIINVRA